MIGTIRRAEFCRAISLGVACLSLSLSGCSTSQSAQDMARVTATNVSTLEAQLNKFAEIQAAVAEQRIASIQELEETLSSINVEQSRIQTTMELAGTSSELSTYKKLVSLSKADQASNRDRNKALADRIAAVRATQQKIAVPTAGLNNISQLLSQLSEEQSKADQVKFLVAFGAAVANDVKNAQEAAKKEATASTNE
jgi:hypothetical protein